MRNPTRLATIGCLASVLLTTEARPSSDGAAPPPPPPIPIFLNAPADRDAFWKMIGRPDFVILDGEEYRKLRQLVEAAVPPATGPAATVESVAVSGAVSGEWASLSVAIGVTMASEGPAWVPIRLDGLPLSRVLEGSRDLPSRMGEGRAWEVELVGKGGHSIVATLPAPVRSTAEGRRLDLPIAVAASTRVELAVPSQVADAGTGINEPSVVLAAEGGSGSRLEARLSPRPRIELEWRERADPAVKLPALLTARGEIAMEVERGAIRSRSSWVVGSIRGAAGQLSVRVGADEEVLDVEVDGRPVQVETSKEAGRSTLVVPLAEPLRPGATRGLVINTQRPIAASGSARVAIQGHAIEHARVQVGFLAVSRVGPIFLNPSPGRGLRRIDPRAELPEGLRARSDIALAFEFNDQPFELGLGVEPAPARLLVENRTTIAVEPRSARVDARLICRPSQGRAFELAVLLPAGLEFEGAGPPEVVASAQAVPLQPGGAGPEGSGAPRVLTITLAPKAREPGAFEVQLRGRCAVDASRAVNIPLFQPLTDPTTGGRFAVVTDRNVSAEPIEGGEAPSAFRDDGEPAPADWVWPARRPGPELGLLWLRADSRPESLPLRVTVRPRSIRHESSTTATLDRKGAEVVDEVSGEVNFGTVSRLDLAIPPEVPARWEVTGVDLEEGRELLGQDPDGTRRYRLKFARAYAESFRLRVRYRMPYPEPLGPSADVRLRLTPVRVLEGTSTGRQVKVAAEPGIEVADEAEGWSPAPITEPPSGPEPGPPTRIAMARPTTGAGRSRSGPGSGRGCPCPARWSRGSGSGRSSGPTTACRPRPRSGSSPGTAR